MCIHTYPCTCASMYMHKTDLASICICMRIALFSSSWWPLNWNSALKLIYKKSNFHINHASAMQSTQPSRQHTKPPPYLHTYNQLWKPGLTEFSIFLSSSSVVPVCVCVWNAVRAFAFNFHHIAFVQFFVVGAFVIVVAMLAVLKWHIRGILFRAFALDATSIKLKSL